MFAALQLAMKGRRLLNRRNDRLVVAFWWFGQYSSRSLNVTFCSVQLGFPAFGEHSGKSDWLMQRRGKAIKAERVVRMMDANRLWLV
jgi:hypothetical protein